ncbi:MAG: hypothetical protein OXC30_04770 [Alphaproteobacteria bacterium]|nr:hypothetical protein [Alphaproteobacteria bacterium]
MCGEVLPNIDVGAPNYLLYADTERKVDTLEELPHMLKRIGCMMEEKPDTAARACIQNVRNRLERIIDYIPKMFNVEKALIFAWAFVMDRQGYRVFYDLGFFWKSKPLSHIWARCLREIPQYLYVLAECTDIEMYVPCMRSMSTLLRHQETQYNCDIMTPREDVNSDSPAWRKMMECDPDAQNHLVILSQYAIVTTETGFSKPFFFSMIKSFLCV